MEAHFVKCFACDTTPCFKIYKKLFPKGLGAEKP